MIGDVEAEKLAKLVAASPTAPALQISEVTLQGTNCEISFPTVAGGAYRVEYKEALTDASWTRLSDYNADCTNTAQVTDLSAGGLASRFYRVRLLSPAAM